MGIELSFIRQGLWGKKHEGENPHVSDSAQPPPEMLRLLPRSFDSLEVWLLSFCGVYGIVISGFLLPNPTPVQLLCLCFLGLAVLKRAYPARTRLQWFASAIGCLFIVGVVVLQPGSGVGDGPFLFLLILLSMGYPLVMDAKLLACFMVAVVGVYWLGVLHVKPQSMGAAVWIRPFFLGGICLMSGRLGAVMRKAEETIDAMRRDAQSLAYNAYGLDFYGDAILRRCRRQGLPFGLVLLRMSADWMDDIGDWRNPAFGGASERSALRQIGLALKDAAPSGALLAHISALDWVLCVPGQYGKHAVERLTQQLGRPLQIPFGDASLEWFAVITPCAGEASPADQSVADVLARVEAIYLRGVRAGVA